MGLLVGTRRSLLDSSNYIQKVLGYDPAAYWPLNETAGVVAICQVNPAQNGTYVGVTLANDITPWGDPVPFFDGINDYVNIYSAMLAAAFSSAAGTMMAWAKVGAVGAWTDGSDRIAYALRAAGFDNQTMLTKSFVNNQLTTWYEANTVTENIDIGGQTSTDWFCMAHTWDTGADEYESFLNGAQQGATQDTLGVWAGALNANSCCIGAYNTTPNDAWHGWLSNAILWDRVLSQTQIADLYIY